MKYIIQLIKKIYSGISNRSLLKEIKDNHLKHLKDDMIELKSNMNELKLDVREIKTDIKHLINKKDK